MIISFSGTSGSGKTTIISEIKKSGIFRNKKIIVRKEDDFLTIKLLKHILGEIFFVKYKEEKFFKKTYNSISYRLFSSLCYVFYPIVVYIEFLIEYVKYQLIFKKTILIRDRFTYDYLVTFENSLRINNKFVQWLYNQTPRPYLSFLIDVDIHIALKRNKNNIPGKITANKLFHENVLNHYRKIAKKHQLLAINNDGNLNEVVKQINSYIKNKEKLLKAGKIVICGLDGTGKTTVANKLAKYANSLNIRCVVVHFYHENLLFKLLRQMGYYNTNNSQGTLYKKSRERSARERLKTTPFILAALRFLDSYVQYLFSLLINRDKLIVFDRYFYDYLVSFEYLNIRWRTFFSKLIPPVKYTFLFESTPMISYLRKPESIKEFYIESHDIYLSLAQKQNIKVIQTDTKNPDQVLQELIENIS